MQRRHFKGQGTYEEDSSSDEDQRLSEDEKEQYQQNDAIEEKQIQVQLQKPAVKIEETTCRAGGQSLLNTKRSKEESEESELSEESSDEEESSSSSSEEEESSEDEFVMKKPVFISKGKRNTQKVISHDKEELAMTSKEKSFKEIERSINRVKDEDIQRRAEESWMAEESTEGLDDSDPVGDQEAEEKEYQLWKARELRRLKKERELLISKEKERDEIEERRANAKDV